MNFQITTETKIDRIEEEIAATIEANLEHMSDAEKVAIPLYLLDYMSDSALIEVHNAYARRRMAEDEPEPDMSQHNNCDGYGNCNCERQEPSPIGQYLSEYGKVNAGLIFIVAIVTAAIVSATPTAAIVGAALSKIGQALTTF